ncbi:putative ribonuclease H-like domain-containing protein [Tanacetum coccineum]
MKPEFLSSLPPEWNTHVVVWNDEIRPEVETISIDDLYNNFKIVEQKDTLPGSVEHQEARMSDMAEEQVQTNMALMAFSDLENEVLFSEEVAVLKREVACKDYEINVLKIECEKVKQEKDGIEFKIEKFDKASKDVDQLPNKLDLSYSGLDEFKEPEFKGYGPENSEQESNIVCDKKSDNSKENFEESLIEEQVSQDTSSFVESSPNVDKETIFPVNKKGKPQQDDKGFVDSGCSRHMTGKHSLSLRVCKKLMEFNLFRVSQMCGNKITMSFLTDTEITLFPKESFDLYVAKATLDESKLWHGGWEAAKSFLISIVFFLTTKDETSEILKNFIKEIENLVDKKVKIIRSDNGTKFKNKVMIILREKGTLEEISHDCIVMPIWKDASYFDSPSKDVGNGEPKSAADDQNPEVNTVRFKLNTGDPSINTASLYDLDSLKDKFKLGSSHTLEATHVEFFSDEDKPEVDLGNILNSNIVPTTPNTRIHKDHPIKNVIGDVKSSIQTRRMAKPTSEQGFLNAVYKEKSHDTLNTYWPIGKRAIGTKWVFRNKKDERGIVIRNKARLVAQGYRQEEVIEYEEVFASVARIEAIRLFLAYAYFMGFLVYQMDVKSAFLYGTIEEEVYITQPPGFKDPDHPDKVYKVVKALYGLHQAPRAWYETLANYLLGNGFKRGKINKTLFIKKQKGDIMLVHVYVEDIIFGSTNKELLQQKEDGIFISQDKYVAEILKKFNYIDVKSASTPVDLEKPLVKDGGADDVDVHIYRSMIGSLMYLTTSRPNIMFAVCACARFQVTPKTSHLLVVKRIFRYLKGKPTLGLWYSRDSPFELVAYTDSDYAGATLERKSTTGGSQFLRNRLISWQCKKQTVVATSTTEAEYVAAASCCGQVLWIQNQLLDYGYNFMNTVINIDNNSTICIIENPVQHSKTKHIEIRHHFIRDCNAKKLIQMVKIHTDYNVADLLTKGFDAGRFQYLVSKSKTSKHVKSGRDTKIPQSSGPPVKVGDEAVHKELGDRMERAATTDFYLETEQDMVTSNKTQNPWLHLMDQVLRELVQVVVPGAKIPY